MILFLVNKNINLTKLSCSYLNIFLFIQIIHKQNEQLTLHFRFLTLRLCLRIISRIVYIYYLLGISTVPKIKSIKWTLSYIFWLFKHQSPKSFSPPHEHFQFHDLCFIPVLYIFIPFCAPV